LRSEIEPYANGPRTPAAHARCGGLLDCFAVAAVTAGEFVAKVVKSLLNAQTIQSFDCSNQAVDSVPPDFVQEPPKGSNAATCAALWPCKSGLNFSLHHY
jgi:hypothetical protein